MSWPMSQDFNEAIQNPKQAFGDPDLQTGEPVVGAHGLPLPRSGNFADVYQLRGADSREWAVKCFTRPVTGLGDRYAAISEALAEANFPFSVGFEFLGEGIKVGGIGRPVVKMEWVEGLLLNHVVRENAGSPKVLSALGQMWVKLCKRLREAGVAHADLQHGNVLLVPGSRPGAYGLKLIDYDGMYVPALANTPSGESGHPSYQHPARAKTRAYSPDVDRFPHLVVLTTLKALSVGGQALWEKYDNGDNLLFIEEDFRNPSASKVMRELWWMGQPAIQSLVGRLAIACVRPIPQTPWIDDLAPEGDPTPLDKETRQAATTALGLAQSVPASLQPERVPLPPEPANDGAAPPEPVMSWRPQTVDVEIVETQAEEVDVEIVEERQSARARKPKEQRRTKAKKSAVSPLMIGIGVLGLVAIVTGAILFSGKKQDPTNVSQADSQKERDKDKKPDTPEGKGPDAILPKPKDKGPDPTTPKPKDTTPDSTPDSTPPSPNPIGLVFKERQRFSIENVRPMYAHFDLEGRSIVLASNRRVAVLDPKNGSMREASKPSTSNLQLLVATLYDGKVCVGRMGEKELSVTDKNGNAAAPIPLPVLPAATGNEEPGSVFQASPSGRYIALGRRGKWVNALTSAERFPTPLRILDTNTGKECYSADWQSGSVIFNANETRMLLVNNFGRGEWFKLPGGEPDGDWKFGLPMAGWAFNVLYASHDAKVLMCNGFINDRPVRFLLNGDTGKVITVLADKGMHYGYQVSADGKLVVSLARGGSTPNNSEWFLNLFDGIRGTELSQIKLPATSVGSYMFVLAPDGRTVVVLDQQTPSNMIVYDVGTETGVAVTPKPPDPTTPIRSKPEVGTLKLRWEAELKNAPNSAIPYFDRDGTVLVLPSRGGSKTDGLSFNARTGKPGIELKAESLLPRVCPLEKGKIGFQHGSGATQFTVWDTTTGKTSATNFPAAGTGPQELTVSSNARYYAVISGAGRDVEAPYRIFDSKTSKDGISGGKNVLHTGCVSRTRSGQLRPLPVVQTPLRTTRWRMEIRSREWNLAWGHPQYDPKW
ncbi:MAG: hypothetical protein K8U57_23985 [Planctomycetes bacterium]|nr:hypothetical protein [Planctomycetota bacterium]